MFPISLTSFFWSFKTSYKILAVVDFPLVPVIVMHLFLKKVKNTSKSVKIFFLLSFRNLDNLQLKILIPGLIMIILNLIFNNLNLKNVNSSKKPNWSPLLLENNFFILS